MGETNQLPNGARCVHSRVRGARLAWTEAGSGPPVIWAHGLTSRSYAQEEAGLFDWAPLASAHRLIRYDARGHGLSSGAPDPAGYTWPELAADLLGLLDEVAPGERVDGVGASMGAATLLYAALAGPGRFGRLVLVTPPTMWETRAEQSRGRLAAADLAERSGKAALEALAGDVPSPALAGTAPGALPIEVDDALLPSVLRGAAASDAPGAAELSRIDVPALVLAWSGDPGHPVSSGEALADCLPDARLRVASTPAELAAWPELVRRFLD